MARTKKFLDQRSGKPRKLVGPEVTPKKAASPEELQPQKTDESRRQA
jgi:hypothetical protein